MTLSGFSVTHLHKTYSCLNGAGSSCETLSEPSCGPEHSTGREDIGCPVIKYSTAATRLTKARYWVHFNLRLPLDLVHRSWRFLRVNAPKHVIQSFQTIVHCLVSTRWTLCLTVLQLSPVHHSTLCFTTHLIALCIGKLDGLAYYIIVISWCLSLEVKSSPRLPQHTIHLSLNPGCPFISILNLLGLYLYCAQSIYNELQTTIKLNSFLFLEIYL